MLQFQALTPSVETASILLEWYNHPSAAHLIRINRQTSALTPMTLDDMLQDLAMRDNFWRYLVTLDGVPIAEATLMVNPLLFLKAPDSSAWLSIVIAPEHRYQGHGESILKFLEQAARERFFSRLEFGAFANNQAAIALYEKNGYTHFHTIPEMSFYAGKWIDDYRFEKKLEPSTQSLLADTIAGLIHLLKQLKHPHALILQQQLLDFRSSGDISAYRADSSLNSVSLKPYLNPAMAKFQNGLFASLRHMSYQLLQAHQSERELSAYQLQGPPALLSALAQGQLTELLDESMI